MRSIVLPMFAGMLALNGCSTSTERVDRIAPPAPQLRMHDDAQELATNFAPAGVTVSPITGDEWSFAVQLVEFGRSTRTAPRSAVPTMVNGRAQYDRGNGWTEWYAHSAVGVEQGFDIADRPSGDGALRIVLATAGLTPSLEGDTVLLSDKRGRVVLHYGQLRVTDAQGALVPSHVEVVDARIALVVDDAHAAYPLVVDPLIWGQQFKLRPSDPTPTVVDGFGGAVLLGVDRAFVGASGLGQVGCSGPCKQGAVYTFARAGSSWTQEAKLTPSDGAVDDWFGYSLALSNDTLLIGSAGHGSRAGAAYVFVRTGSTWTQQAMLTASDGAANDFFGTKVALDGDTALIGANAKNSYTGAAYVFVRSGTTWTQQAKLAASDAATSDVFGASVALQSGTALVGASGKSAVYVFSGSGGTWTQQAKLQGSDTVSGDTFGGSLSFDGDTALIGAASHGGQGAAYAFTRSGTTWTEQAQVLSTDLASGDYYGVTVALSANLAVIGAQNKANGATTYAGAAYVMARSGTTWTQRGKLLPFDAGSADYFSRVALHGDTALVGAYGKNAAYVFVNRKANGDACASGSECTSGICTESVCCDATCTGTCKSCLAANTGSVNGHCAFIPDAVDPRSECGATTCAAGVVERHLCDGAGGCRSAKTPCTPFVCSMSTPSCLSSCASDADCDAEHYCKGTACLPRKTAGTACDGASECKSSLFCVDGVCCDAPCDGQCAACDNADSVGKCTAVKGKPHGKRAACDGSGACAGTCDGKTAESCTFADAATPCDKGCFDANFSTCDGKGACQPARPCSGNLTCENSMRCRSSCSKDTDCLTGFRCNEGACVAGRRKCSEDLARSIDTVDGTSITCAPYTCDSATSACRKTCETSNDCAAGFGCDTGTKTCVALPSEDEGGCSVGSRSRGRSGAGILPILAALIAFGVRRRRAAKGSPLLLFAVLASCSSKQTTEPVSTTEGGFAESGLGIVGRHAGLGLTAAAEKAGLSIRPPGSEWSWSPALVRLGRGVDRTSVSPVSPRVERGRATYAYGGVKEWYALVDGGVEQGFDLSSRPSGAGELVFELSTRGLQPALAGQTVSLRDANGVERLRYGELHVKDVQGREIPARIAVDDGRIALHVDDALATYPLVVDPLIWGEQGKILPTDLASGDRFGGAVSVSGDTAIVGASYQTSALGAAYVYLRSGPAWTQQAKLVPADGTTNEYFGTAVAISKDTVVVGAPSQTSSTGAVYVYVRSGTTWTQQAKLLPDDVVAGDYFGGSLALQDDTLVVSSSSKNVGSNARQGVTYVFGRSGTTWSQITKLDPADGAADDRFGGALALYGDTVIATSAGRSFGKGMAFAFVRTGTTWSKQATLVASDGVAGTASYLAGDIFGSRVALYGDTALISAPNKTIGTTKGAGSVYAFDRSGTTWTQTAQFTQSAVEQEFGASIALVGNNALVGVPKSFGGKGKLLPFQRVGTAWVEGSYLVPADAQLSDFFGQSLAYTGDTAIAGATFRTSTSGVAYAFVLRKAAGDTCTSGSECLSNVCTDGVCCPVGCAGKCLACALAQTGMPDGVCAPIVDGSDPHGDCPAPTCTSGLTTTNVCDGTGGCRSKTIACTPFVCDSTGKSCLGKCTADADCIAADYCDSTGACVPRKPAAAGCGTGNECAAGLFCVDGLCCDAPCTGQCEACDVSGSLGKCSPVSGRTHGKRAACEGDGACGGTCDGKTTGACSYPGTSTACDKGCDLGALSTCDGKGACQAPIKCAKNLQCENATTCRVSCTEDAHCVEGFGCRQGECVARLRGCTEDRTASIDPVDDSHTACVAYACDPSSGACGTICATTTDCLTGYICNQGVCEKIEAPSDGGGGDEGGCRYGHAAPSGGVALALLGLMAFARRRR